MLFTSNDSQKPFGLARLVIVLNVIAICFAPQLAAAQAYPTATYAETIPTLEQVVGHDHGEAISSVSDISDYFHALEEAASDRIQVRNYGQTWQGRDLIYAVISSPENMQRLDAIQMDMGQLSSGQNLNAADQDRIIADIPAVVWLSYGVHGDEITPPDSALFVAYHLLAAENDALVDKILDDVIVIIDPSQNPDGRARFVHSFESSLGLEPLADRHTAEHDQPWPRGRYNHYLFDLNRDWFALTQPETKGKVSAVLEWNPVVYVDSHEMSGDSTYFFPPPARPLNPLIVPEQRAKQSEMGLNHAKWFDKFGVPYFTREVYDAFYPGYGDMWPTLNGATAMTHEQASPRGLLFARHDGTKLTYAEGVRNNVLTSLSALEVVARNKSKHLTDYADYRKSAVDSAQDSKDRYVVLDLSSWTFEAESLAGRMASQGVAVQRTRPGTSQCGRSYENGALIIDLAQPRGRLARTLLAPSTELAADFIDIQEDRRARNLNHELYDVTAWSLPLMDNVSSQMCANVDLSDAVTVDKDATAKANISGQASFGYAVPWTDGGQARLVIAALKAGLYAKSTDKSFEQGGTKFPSGTVIFPTSGNSADFRQVLEGLAQTYGSTLIGMPNSWVDRGPNFGSRAFKTVELPKIAMVWGEGTRATSAGNTRFVLERQLGLPVAPIRLSNLENAELGLYDVLIVPDMRGDLPLENVRRFAKTGGVVIGLQGAINALAQGDTPLLATQREFAALSEEVEKPSSDDETEDRAEGLILETKDDYERYISNHAASPEDVPGVLAKASANTDHWLAAGYDTANVLVIGNDIYRPLKREDGENVFSFSSADELLLSGYLWEENRAQLAHKPFVMMQTAGDGMVIGFTQDPTTRAYLHGLNLLLVNAVVLGTAQTSG